MGLPVETIAQVKDLPRTEGRQPALSFGSASIRVAGPPITV